MRTLTPAERRAFRAKAHHLRPNVIVGHHGLTPAVLHEIDVNLLAHELVKIRVQSDDRSEREALLTRISDELDAAPVQHLGKILTVWRPTPEPEAAAPKSRARPAARPGQPARSKPSNDAQRTRSDPKNPRARKPKIALSGPEWQRRKPGLRSDATAKFTADPGARRRKPGPRSDATAKFTADPGARRRKPGPRSDATAKFTADPGARRRKPGPRGDAEPKFAGDPGARRRKPAPRSLAVAKFAGDPGGQRRKPVPRSRTPTQAAPDPGTRRRRAKR